MHDPSFLAMSIHSPIPTRERWSDAYVTSRWTLGRSRRTNAENLGEPTYPWWKLKGYRPVVAGRAFRFPSVIDIWHDEPGGRDSGEVCKYPHGWELRKHLDHLHVRVIPLGRLRRTLLTRCAWCGGPSRKHDNVNCSMQWDAPSGKWWQGEPNLFHRDCSSIAQAHRTCICDEPRIEIPAWTVELHLKEPQRWPLARPDHGKCLECGRFRASGVKRPSAVAAIRLQQAVPTGVRPTQEQAAAIRDAWAVFRAEEDAICAAERIVEDAHRA